MRITHRTLATTMLTGLQENINKLGDLQQKLSSGKEISKPSDSPAAAGSAMLLRSEVNASKQYSRNADDGLGWLGAADGALSSVLGQVNRVRDLVVQGMSSGSYGGQEARDAIAEEVENLRNASIGVANTKYLDRPIFGGTTNQPEAFDANGVYRGDGGQVMRTVGRNMKVRVDSPGEDVFGSGADQMFTVLTDIVRHMRTSPAALQGDLARLDTASHKVQSGLSSVGARYNQVERMQQAASDNVLNLRKSLSSVEDIDLPKTITELQLQQTAYQAALAAGARSVQPSLVDFLK
jgi:flagellar hook-associated protein 3 FlgL